MTITAARQQELLNAQTDMARKVFYAVPIQEPFSSNQILAALQRTTQSTIQFRMLEGCLNKLCDSGLIIEPSRGQFQRITPREKITKPPPITEANGNGHASEAVELLTELADRARKLAQDIDAAAAVIAEEAHANEDGARKLRQLQEIFKGLA
jgi:hypothetical protein